MNKATQLLCNNIKNPLGVDSPIPFFSWRTTDQTAYRIIVSESENRLAENIGNIWDSGIVKSEAAQNVDWCGGELKTAVRYYWKVKVWDKLGNESDWSNCEWFEMGMLHSWDWRGRWIQYPKPYHPTMIDGPAPIFRKSFNIGGQIASARVYVCGLGLFELYINGCKVGKDVLTPGFTVYDKTCLYCTYDVTHMLREGENVFGAILGNGMYFVEYANAWDFEKAHWRDKPKMLLQASIRLEDGSEQHITTGEDWKVNESPIICDSLYVGETYDARLEMPGWCQTGFDSSAWQNAAVCPSPGGKLVSMQMEHIKVVEEFLPKSMHEIRPGEWIYDMGRNIAGWTRLKVSGPRGTVITIKYAEKLLENGDIDDSNINCFVKSNVFQQDQYTLKGEGIEYWEPRFTYHGFQYVCLAGYPCIPALSSLTACVVHTDLPTIGSFSCSNELLNKIQSAARASTLNNWHGMPTDCPHREKNGWTGDAMMSSEQVLFNFQAHNAYRKWLHDIVDCQRPSGQLSGIAPTSGWGYNWGSGPSFDSAIVFIPWNIWLYTGKKAVLEENWPAIKQYIKFLDSMSDNGIVDFGMGDWMPGVKLCAFVATWFYYADLHIASKIASVLDKADESSYFAMRAETIRQAFLREFIDVHTGDVEGSCQTSYALALQYGISNSELASKIHQKLVDDVEKQGRHIDANCGIVGTKYVLSALAEGGRADLAYSIVTQNDFPSWGYWIKQGATTLWEKWNGKGSHNHHMFSSVCEFFYKTLAGINPDENDPGFRHIILKPNLVSGLSQVKARHESNFGIIRIDWTKENDDLKLDIDVPDGATATLILPKEFHTIDINASKKRTADNGIKLNSGTYKMYAYGIQKG